MVAVVSIFIYLEQVHSIVRKVELIGKVMLTDEQFFNHLVLDITSKGSHRWQKH